MQKTMPSHRRRATRVDSPYAWFRLGVSLLLGTIGGVGLWSIVVILPAVQQEFEVDRAAASLPYTATMIGFGLGNVIVGRYVDRLGIAIPVYGAAILLGIGYGLSALTINIWQLTLVQGLVIGLGGAATFGPLIANISLWFVRRRGIAVAIAASGNYLAGTVWPVVIQKFVETDGWRMTSIGIGVVCLVTMIPLSLLLLGKAPSQTSERDGNGRLGAGAEAIKSAGFSPNTLQVLLIVAGVGCCVAMSMPQVHLVAYCMDLGYGPAAGAEMLSMMLAAGVVSRIVSGFIADYIGGVRTVLLGSVLQCIALSLFLPFDGLVSLYAVSVLFGLSQGGIVPSYALIVREYLPAREAGQRVGLVIMATIFGMALGGWLSGWIYDQTASYRLAFINGIAWNFLNICIMLLILWRTKRAVGGGLRAVQEGAVDKRQARNLDNTLETARDLPAMGRATVVTGIASLIALVFSGLSLYETVLKQASLHLYVPETIGYTRDPNGSFEVFVIPVTVANSGARDGIVSSLKLKVRNLETGKVKELAASFVAVPGYYSTKEDVSKGQSRPKTAFAPISVPGRDGFTGTVLFYPKAHSGERVVPGAGQFEIAMSAEMIAVEDLGALDKFWVTTIRPVTFTARLPAVSRYFEGQMLTGQTVRLFVDKPVKKADGRSP